MASLLLYMHTLHSVNKVSDYPSSVFSVDDVYWKLDEAAVLDGTFRNSLANSLGSRGMLWPPILWTQETFLMYLQESGTRHDPNKDINTPYLYRVAIGNNRFCYAKENGYTHIECVVAGTWQDRATILSKTLMEYGRDF